MIRLATSADDAAIVDILEPVFREGETYTVPRDLSRVEMLAYWLADGHEVFVFVEDSQILGTYFLQANQRGGGAPVANCGYVTAKQAVGRGIARAMCVHSLEGAKERGFKAMQFNFVVSTNERAVRLWEGSGFSIMGRLPEAFLHPRLGYVDAFVMYRTLSD